MKRILTFLLLVLPASITWLSCGYSSPGNGNQTSGLKYRAFVSNSVSFPGIPAGVYIVDAQNDLRAHVPPISAGNTPGMMVVTPNRAQTLVFSGNGLQTSDNVLSLINNSTEQNAVHVTLPGMTESFVVSPDSSTTYVAVPTAPVVGQPPGVLEVISLGTGQRTGQAEVPAIHYLAVNHSGSRVLGFSDNSDSIAIITPTQIGIGNAVSYVCCFDRPVAAFFTSDDSTAYVVNCGVECGGTQAGVQILDLTTSTAGTALPVPAATVALANGSTMYLAGTPSPASPCTGQQTAATTCGLLTIVNLAPPMSVINTTPIVITDGYHNRIALAANGQLFIGARTCTEIVPPVPPPPGAEIRGCLSIYNSLPDAIVGTNPPGGVVVPPANGDATGIEPISTRTVVYVIQGGSLDIYDTSDDLVDTVEEQKLENLVGNFFDVKTVDF